MPNLSLTHARAVCLLASSTCLAGCGADPDDSVVASDEPVATDVAAIANGTLVSPNTNPGAIALYHHELVNGVLQPAQRPCSAVLIARNWVLTALHCVVENPFRADESRLLDSRFVFATGPDTVSPGLQRPASGFIGARPGGIIGHPPPPSGGIVDLAVVNLLDAFQGNNTSNRLFVPRWYSGTHQALRHRILDSYGYGRVQSLSNVGAGTLRKAQSLVSGIDAFNYRTLPVLPTQGILNGDSGGPDYLAASSTLVGIHSTGNIGTTGALDPAASAASGSIDFARAWIKRARHTPGDLNRDRQLATGNRLKNNGLGRADIALIGSPTAAGVVVGTSLGDGGFARLNVTTSSSFNGWTREPNVRALPADFNGDGYGDLALVGGAGWTSFRVAYYQPGGAGGPSFASVSVAASSFASQASTSGVQPVTGDFNGDGWTDIALPGFNASQPAISLALSNSDDPFGAFVFQSVPIARDFQDMSRTGGAKLVSGDFDGDAIDDLAVVGQSPLAGIAIAGAAVVFASATFPHTAFGNFVYVPNTTFMTAAMTQGAKVVVGDYNGDGRDDIALVGGTGWSSIKVFVSDGGGTFTLRDAPVGDFAIWATQPGAQPTSGDFNADGKDDIALAGGNAWNTVPVVMARADGMGFMPPTNTPTAVAEPARGARLVPNR